MTTNDGRTIEYRGIRFLTVGKGTLQCQTCLQVTHDHIGHAADHAAPTPVPLTATQLDALPPGSAVRCTTERGMRTSLALKLGGYGLGANSWVTTDGTTFPSSFAIAQADAVLLVPAAVATAPAPVSDTRREDVEALARAINPGATTDHDREEARQAALRVLAVLPAPPVVDETSDPALSLAALAAVLGDVWDDGNAVGLDGWVGPGRGEAVDEHAVLRRARAVENALGALVAGGAVKAHLTSSPALAASSEGQEDDRG
ncbi:hypothetical protein ACFWGN_17915 [Oerskovia sp. NPDC060338]|uniref:hypothetical protein n=1 Tax=Oerskovia sp. NPDC060338 TaxID=3347100 RepID=UPI003665E949